MRALAACHGVEALLVVEPSVYAEVGYVTEQESGSPFGKDIPVGSFLLRTVISYAFVLFSAETGKITTSSDVPGAALPGAETCLFDLGPMTPRQLLSFMNTEDYAELFEQALREAVKPLLPYSVQTPGPANNAASSGRECRQQRPRMPPGAAANAASSGRVNAASSGRLSRGVRGSSACHAPRAAKHSMECLQLMSSASARRRTRPSAPRCAAARRGSSQCPPSPPHALSPEGHDPPEIRLRDSPRQARGNGERGRDVPRTQPVLPQLARCARHPS